LGPSFPALLLAQRDATQPGVEALAAELVRRGVPLLVAGAPVNGAIALPTLDCSPELAPLLLAQSAYRLIAALALRRGFDPDHPAHLRKVTQTV
jgi:glucosamine--fructose-6-phosphate aminotransferase (isomerizing)